MADHHDYITAALHQQQQAALGLSKQRATQRRWQARPALAGRTLTDVADIAGDAYHPEHNTVAAALIDAHHTGRDETATVVLLVAARPLVLTLDPRDRYHDSRASLWAAVARRLAVIDPDQLAASTIPFLVHLLGRIRSDATKHPSELPANNPTESTQLEQLLNRRPAPEHDIPGWAIARITVDAAQHDHAWAHLARYATYGTRIDLHPNYIARQRRRLAHTIGYAA